MSFVKIGEVVVSWQNEIVKVQSVKKDKLYGYNVWVYQGKWIDVESCFGFTSETQTNFLDEVSYYVGKDLSMKLLPTM